MFCINVCDHARVALCTLIISLRQRRRRSSVIATAEFLQKCHVVQCTIHTACIMNCMHRAYNYGMRLCASLSFALTVVAVDPGCCGQPPNTGLAVNMIAVPGKLCDLGILHGPAGASHHLCSSGTCSLCAAFTPVGPDRPREYNKIIYFYDCYMCMYVCTYVYIYTDTLATIFIPDLLPIAASSDVVHVRLDVVVTGHAPRTRTRMLRNILLDY